LALTFVSRASLRKPGSHGFYRFFAWECMLGMYVLNMRVWHVDWHSTHQIIAGLLFFTSLLLVLFGVAQLLLSGKPDTNRNDAPLLEFEKTTILVTTGLYRYIRHPIYGSLFLLSWGLFFKQPSLVGGILAIIASSFLVATSRVEEAENLNYFGEKYRKYMKRTKMFIPFIL
jgi:protein-S-isoprenylcysteine O-methyltransferase Ste14